jgi:hypothetical protein
MKPPKQHGRTVTIIGISDPKNILRFEHFIQKSFRCKRVEDRGQYVVTHWRIQDTNPIDVIVFTSDKIYISGSPLMPKSEFDQIATRIARIAQDSVSKLAEERPVTLQRARSILEFTLRLNPEDEFERMVMVILADTSNEIVLTERMKALKIKGPPLEEGIPNKIECIKDKGSSVYKEAEIRNVRELRNGIVHTGNIPTSGEAKRCLEISLDVLENA